MNKEHWIDKIIEQSKHISEVNPNPILRERILKQVNIESQLKSSSTNTILKWSVAACIITLLNASVIFYNSKGISHNHHKISTVKSISNSFDNSTTYSY